MKQKQFFILSLPRSRTAWLANALTNGNSFCLHEGLLKNPVKTVFKDIEYSVVGNSDCSNILFLDEIRETYPKAKLVLIDRPVGEVYFSLIDMGIMTLEGEKLLMKTFSELEKAKIDTNVLVVPFNEIDKNIKDIWQYCTEEPVDAKRFEMLSMFKIEVSMEPYMNNLMKYKNTEQFKLLLNKVA